MENNFEKVMSERTDEELIKIVTVEREDYQAIAIETAEKEIKSRNLNIQDFNDITENIKIEKENEIKEQEKSGLIRPNKKRAEIAQLLIWIVMILDVISIYSSYLQYNLLTSLQNNETISDHIINSNDTREQIIGIVYFIVFIVSAITFIQWFRRAYYNLNIRIKCNHTEGWAAGSWFVPIISFYRPYEIMKEMWIGTTKLLKTKSNDYINNSTLIIGFWWALWIISNYLGNYVLKSAFKAETIVNFINSTLADMIMSIIGIPLAILTVMIIKSYSLKEEKLTELDK